MATETRQPINASTSNPGPYLAKVISHLDPNYMGTLAVQLLREVGNDPNSSSQIIQVKYMSPFYGVTSLDHNLKDTNNYNATQKSYGMWMIPPDVGTIVVVIFIEGDPRRGYWIGCVPDDKMNFMVPGYAATNKVVGQNSSADNRVPVGEYNKKSQTSYHDATNFLKPEHPFKKILETQGLLKDDIRGITTSSARREVPSSVFGISTPGPLDKRSGAPKGTLGSSDHKVTSAFTSRLGGSSFVMDDGDDKFLRASPASDGPPQYKSVENPQSTKSKGDPTIPHNELIRLRTRTGHQILLHNSEDLIYIGNAKGTTWIELTSNGKIDIYAEDSISIHTANDVNVTADKRLNLYAKKGMNITSDEDIKMHSKKGINLTCEEKMLIASNKDINIKSKAKVNVNGQVPEAFTPKQAKIPSRAPSKEPWILHENLDPANSKYDKSGNTIIDLGNDQNKPDKNPEYWKKYTTNTDTFKR